MATPEKMPRGFEQSRTRQLGPQNNARPYGSLGWGLLSCTLLACGGSPKLDQGFKKEWQRRDGHEGRAVMALLGAPKPSGPGVAVGISGQELVGRTLPDGALWRYPSAPTVLPSISGGTVALTTDNELVVLNASDGTELFRKSSADRRLEGYSFDGNYGIFLLVDQDDARPDLIAILDRQGKTIAESQTVSRVGAPLATNGLGLVPWNNQYVSAFELSTGKYQGRLVARSAPSRVLDNPTGYFLTGGGGMVSLDLALADNPDVRGVTFPSEQLPGQPEWPVDGSKPRIAKSSPISLLGEPLRVGAETRFAGDQLVVTYYELVAGLSAKTHAPVWVNHLSHTVIGADTNPDGVLFCLEDGVLEFSSYDGSQQTVSSLGSRLQACTVDSGNLRPSPQTRPPLEAQIVEALRATGPSLGAFHDFLLKHLGEIHTREATGALLAIARDPATPAPLLKSTRSELEKRDVGVDLLLAAVQASAQERANPTQTANVMRPVPLAELAKVLERAGEKAAAAPLARHLPAADVSAREALAILSALLVLGGPTEVPLVYDFLVANKNVATNAEYAESLQTATRFLVRQGGMAREQAKQAIEDTMTHPDLKRLLLQSYEDELARSK